ncbi:hypothetical protein [Caulobacter sp. 602-1]|uniref:hypothetical protein n=1 Tax=Caulobacter sp. 602-1 TaxID=2492472 RepID=UPI000F641104|nr:hypothetical protein [Caulobacter sp. 602-1]RRN63484.1 hypothetical protein EIK80_16860 [Caulobacter sp. 602-1]
MAITWTSAKSKLAALAIGLLKFLWQDKIPLIIVAVATSLGTFWIAPVINQTFERQKMQATYVLENLRELNRLISDIYVDVSAISYTVAAGKIAPDDKVIHARENLVRLNWKLIETASMLSREEDRRVLREFQESVSAVVSALNGSLDIRGCNELLSRVEVMSKKGSVVIATIGKRADLGVSLSQPVSH